MKRFVRAQWDRVGAGVAVILGVVALFVGWLGVSHVVYPAEQLPYIVGYGLGGLALVGVGATLWLSADLRDEWVELHDVAHRLDAAPRADRD
jgi:divalent metal cation (Fe/Co/Zn/Cd) transporter